MHWCTIISHVPRIEEPLNVLPPESQLSWLSVRAFIATLVISYICSALPVGQPLLPSERWSRHLRERTQRLDMFKRTFQPRRSTWQIKAVPVCGVLWLTLLIGIRERTSALLWRSIYIIFIKSISRWFEAVLQWFCPSCHTACWQLVVLECPEVEVAFFSVTVNAVFVRWLHYKTNVMTEFLHKNGKNEARHLQRCRQTQIRELEWKIVIRHFKRKKALVSVTFAYTGQPVINSWPIILKISTDDTKKEKG